MEENTVIEVTTEDKIAKLKTTLEGMELLGATIPQQVKDAVNQEIATLEAKVLAEAQALEAKAKEETQILKENAISWFERNRIIVYVAALFVISHIIGKLGF